ncbi:MAG: TonB-dependent receptor, partial [Brevundimonas sp.]
MVRAFLSALAAALAAATPMSTRAQDGALVDVSVAPQPLRSALIDFGLQAGITINAGGSDRCGSSRGVRGRLSADRALSRLMLGTHCAAIRVGPGAWRVVRLAAPAPVAARTVTEPEAATPTLLDDVVVTAARSDHTLLSRAPYGLSSLDGLALERASVTDLQGVAARVAGLTVTNLGPGRDKVFIRGMADGPVAGQTQALVGLYLDDVRLTYDAPDPALRLADVER